MQSTEFLRVGVFLGGLLAAQVMSRAAVVTYAAPAGEALSSEYEVVAQGKKVDVYTARVLDPPFAALDMALTQRRPPLGLLHHSDRGVQYASGSYRQRHSPRQAW